MLDRFHALGRDRDFHGRLSNGDRLGDFLRLVLEVRQVVRGGSRFGHGLLPPTIVASSVKNSEYDDCLRTEYKENTVRKSPGQHAPHLGTTA